MKTWPVRQLLRARANGVFFLHLMVNIVILHMENLPHKISTYNYVRSGSIAILYSEIDCSDNSNRPNRFDRASISIDNP